MKKLTLVFVGLFVMAVSIQKVNAQSSASARADATATIITPIGISNDADGSLVFGNIVPTATAGSVVISPTTGTEPLYSNVYAFANDAGSPQPASFTVTGVKDAAYKVTLPSSATLRSGRNTMEVSSFSDNVGTSPKITNGSVNFKVGATLAVGAKQDPGAYTGEFTVTVAYE